MLVNHFLENSAARLPEKVALVCGEQRLTYGQIDALAVRLAARLAEMGIRRHDRVVVLLDNSPEAVISIFGVLKAGAIFVVLNPAMKARKLGYILRDSGARALIAHTSRKGIVQQAVEDAPDLEHIIWCGGELGAADDGKGGNREHKGKFKSNISWSEIFAHPPAQEPPWRVAAIDVDLATIIYTSGSTGEPKGVMSAHYNMVAAAQSITQYLENTEADVILDVLPLSFDYGLYQLLMCFMVGGTLVLEKSFVYPYKVIERLVGERVTGFPLVPTIAAILLQLEDLSKFDFSSLRYITNTAAALPVATIRRLQQCFPQTRIFSMYGLTECKRVSYLPPVDLDRKPESVGIPIPNTEVLIMGEDGQSLGPGETGELVVRGRNVMQGYWNAPEETSRAFRPGPCRGDARLFTGDLFRKDDEGFLYFVGRRDDLIKTKGERVSPREIENALCEMDGVAEAAVVGIPDDIFGSAIKAFIVARKGFALAEKEVLKHCQRNLEPFMVPKFVELRETLPKSPNGKIDKKRLFEQVADRHAPEDASTTA